MLKITFVPFSHLSPATFCKLECFNYLLPEDELNANLRKDNGNCCKDINCPSKRKNSFIIFG